MTNEAATKEELSQLAQVFEIGVASGEFEHSNSAITYSNLSSAYQTITGNTMPFAEAEVSYNNKVLTLNRRDVTATYDFNSKALAVS